MKVYIVGGYVRDTLLGLPVTDRDYVVVGSNTQDMLSLGYKQVGKDFPVFLHPQTNDEYALARVERKVGVGYGGFEFDSAGVTLEEDLMRRDLTINAMAMEDGKLIDPYNGKHDLENRILRHVGSAFAEDPLRVLRVARFAAKLSSWGFTIDKETIGLMRSLKSELSSLTPERVLMETEKAFKTSAPLVYFEILRQADALETLFGDIDIQYIKRQLKVTPLDIDLRFAVFISKCKYPFNNKVKLYKKFIQLEPNQLAATIERYKLTKDKSAALMLKKALIASGNIKIANCLELILKRVEAIDTSIISAPPGPEYGNQKIALIQNIVDLYVS